MKLREGSLTAVGHGHSSNTIRLNTLLSSRTLLPRAEPGEVYKHEEKLSKYYQPALTTLALLAPAITHFTSLTLAFLVSTLAKVHAQISFVLGKKRKQGK